MRGQIIDAMFDRMARNPDIFFLTADMGINLVEKFEEKYPERFLNVGIAEQNLVGVSAGLANLGFRPFAYTISNFAVHRCFEQIRNDIGIHDYPVVMLGTSAGFDNAPLGPTHHIIDDWGAIKTIPEIDIYCPSSVTYAGSLVDHLLAAGRPAYVRIPKGAHKTPDSTEHFVLLPGAGNTRCSCPMAARCRIASPRRSVTRRSPCSCSTGCGRSTTRNLRRPCSLTAGSWSSRTISPRPASTARSARWWPAIRCRATGEPGAGRLHVRGRHVERLFSSQVRLRCRRYPGRQPNDGIGFLGRSPRRLGAMDIHDTRKCNLWNLEKLAEFLAPMAPRHRVTTGDSRNEKFSARDQRASARCRRPRFHQGYFQAGHRRFR